MSYAVALIALAITTSTAVVLRSPERAGAAGTAGYWLVGTDGGIFNFGQAGYFGSTGGVPLNQPIVGLAPAPSGRGYWMVASDGGIFAFGDAGFYGSMGGKPLNKPIVALAPSKTGRGYWMVASDGGIFAFGDAGFYGSMGGSRLNKPIADIAATPTGRGYWLTATDGGVFAYGDAGFFGSVGSVDLVKRIQAMAPTPSGRGYWMVAGDGGIFAFGDAGFFGSASSGGAEKRAIDITPSGTGNGYYVTTSNGQVLSYGDAKNYGGTDNMRLNNRISSMSAMNAGEPPVAVDDLVGIDEDLPITIDVLANDRDPDGGQLTLKGVGAPLRGVAVPSGRNVSYTPNADYNGPDFFTYTVGDDTGNTATGRVNVTVKAVDDKPAVIPDTAAGPEDAPIGIPVLGNDTGLGDGLKAITVSAAPAHGKATVNDDHTITYVPEKHYNGDDSFTYKVVDTDDDSATGKVTVTVAAVDNVPKATSDSAQVRAGKSAILNIAANDDSPDGVAIKFTDDQGNPTEAAEVTTSGNGTAKRDAPGKVIYTAPKGAFTGPDTFKYVIVDNDGDVSTPATVQVTVGANAAPKAKDGTFEQTVSPGETVQGNIAHLGTDPEGDSVSFWLKTKGMGDIELHKDGSFIYTAPADGTTSDTFSFAVTDGNQDSNVATVTIHVATPPPSTASTTTSSPPPPSAPPAAAIAPLAGAGELARRRRRRRS